MPNNSPINTTKIELTDLNNYRNNLSTNSTPPSITNFLMLSSELRTEGLNSLNNALNSGVGIEEIREKYSQDLLKDLESLTKRADFQELTRDIPKFKPEFYAELTKPLGNKSKEFKQFITSCANIMKNIEDRNDITCTELISAKMLVFLDQEDITTKSLRDKLTADLTAYKKKSTTQTARDIGVQDTDDNRQQSKVGRQEVFFKDKHGHTKILSKETLLLIESLTGEQKDFIVSMWHQGRFGTGWFMDAAKNFQDKIIEDGGLIDLNSDKDFLMIDISENGQVKVRSRLAANIVLDREKINEKINYAQGVLEVDISDLKNDKFTPGCGSAEPKINFYISEFSKDYKYPLPKDLKFSQDLQYDNVRQGMMEDKKQACIDEIINNGPNKDKALYSLSRLTGLDENVLVEFKKENVLEGLKKVTVSEIQNLPDEAKIEALAVRCHKEINPKEARTEFVKWQLTKYCDKQDIKFLDSKEIERIKNGIVAILDPVIDDPKEKKDLNNNIKGVIRYCAKQENVSMSFKEKLKSMIEVILKANPLKNIINKYQAAVLIGKPSQLQNNIKRKETEIKR